MAPWWLGACLQCIISVVLHFLGMYDVARRLRQKSRSQVFNNGMIKSSIAASHEMKGGPCFEWGMITCSLYTL